MGGVCCSKEKQEQDPIQDIQIKKPEKQQENPNGGQSQGEKKQENPNGVQSQGEKKQENQQENQSDRGQTIVSNDPIFQGQGQKIQSDYTIITKKLGESEIGDVREAVNKQTGLIYAVKIYQKQNQQDERSELLNRINILKSLDHPNILKIHGFYEDAKTFYKVSDLCQGGDLYERIQKEQKFTEKKACEIIVSILKAIKYLHSKNIIHRDIRSEAILFENQTTDGQIKIVHLGFSQIFEPNKKYKKQKGQAYSPYFVAPEVLNDKFTYKCDIWSIGGLLYTLLSGLPPFLQGEGAYADLDLINKVKNDKVQFPSQEWSNISQEAKDLINCMLNRNESKRYDAEQCLNHNWIKNNEVKNEEIESNQKGALKNMKGYSQQQVLQQEINLFVINNLSTSEEKKALEDTFKALDTDNDGKLTRDELIQGYRKTMDQMQAISPDNEVDRIMAQVDRDKSGSVEYSEFLMATLNNKKGRYIERLENAFKMFDQDKSGKLSLNEIKNMFGRTKGTDEKYWADFMKENDKNQDGEISLEEFKALMLKIVN